VNDRERAAKIIEQTMSRAQEVDALRVELKELQGILGAEMERCNPESHEYTAAKGARLCVDTLVERMEDRVTDLMKHCANLAQTHNIDIAAMKII